MRSLSLLLLPLPTVVFSASTTSAQDPVRRLRRNIIHIQEKEQEKSVQLEESGNDTGHPEDNVKFMMFANKNEFGKVKAGDSTQESEEIDRETETWVAFEDLEWERLLQDGMSMSMPVMAAEASDAASDGYYPPYTKSTAGLINDLFT